MLLLLGLIGLSTVLGLLAAWPMAVMVDAVMTTTPKSGLIYRLLLAPLPASRLGQVIGLAVMAMLIKLAADLIGTSRTIVTNHLNFRGLRRIRCDLYRKLQTLHLGYHHSQPQGDAIYRLTFDTLGFQVILSTILMTFVAFFTLAAIISTLTAKNIGLTLIALCILPPLLAVNVWFGRRLRQRSLEVKPLESEYTTQVQRSMSCIGLVQAFGREHDCAPQAISQRRFADGLQKHRANPAGESLVASRMASPRSSQPSHITNAMSARRAFLPHSPW
jgi:ABC-type multidrug transport system fused ATPase/permease subunit